MSSIDKELADKIAACDGVMYPDEPHEPAVTRVVEYTTAWGDKAYGVTFEGQDLNKYMRETEYVNAPRIYWERA